MRSLAGAVHEDAFKAVCSGSCLDFDGFTNERRADHFGASHDLHQIFLRSRREPDQHAAQIARRPQGV